MAVLGNTLYYDLYDIIYDPCMSTRVGDPGSDGERNLEGFNIFAG